MASGLTLDGLTKTLATTVLAAYLLGLLATSAYLYQRDIPLPDVDALKPNLVYCGFSVLLILAAAAVVLLLTIWISAKPPAAGAPGAGPTPAPQPLRLTVNGMGFFLSASFFEWMGLVGLLQRNHGYLTAETAWTAVQLMFVSTCSAALLLLGARRNTHTFDGLTFTMVASGGAALMWLAVLFGVDVAAEVPGQFGGLGPTRAALVLTTDGVASAKAAGLPFDGTSSRSQPVRILYRGNDFYAVELPDGRVLQIKKDTIVGAVEDSRVPTAQDIRTEDGGGHPGTPEAGDRLRYTFSERMDPTSLLEGWDGRPVPVQLRGSAATDRSHDEVTVWSTDEGTQVALGKVEFRIGVLSTLTGDATADATMEQDDNQIVITLEAPIELSQPQKGTLLVWVPSPDATDPNGNPVVATAVSEANDDTPDSRPEF